MRINEALSSKFVVIKLCPLWLKILGVLMVSTEQFKKAVGLINNAKNVLLTSHTRPDGDACGSIAAMCDDSYESWQEG